MTLCGTPTDYVKEAIESLRSQTLKDFELVLAYNQEQNIDGLSDYLCEIGITHFFIPTAKIIGRNGRFKAAVEECLGRWIVVLDADDRLVPESLEVVKECLSQSPNIHFFCSGHREFSAGTAVTTVNHATPMLQTVTALSLGFRQRHLWGFANQLERRPKNFFQTQLASEDYNIFCELAMAGTAVLHIPFTLYEYRLHPFQSTVIFKEDFDKTSEELRSRMRRFLKNAPPMWHYGDMALATRMITQSARIERDLPQYSHLK